MPAKNNPPQKAVFWSFANPDRELVKKLARLFGETTHLNSFYAPFNLERGSPDWVEAIRSGIKDSTAFVPILTRHSLYRQWVWYECGAADMHGLPFYYATTSSVQGVELGQLPGKKWMAFDISNGDSLVNLFINLYENYQKSSAHHYDQELLRKNIGEHPLLPIITKQAGMRSVFFAGSLPPQDKVRSDLIVPSRPEANVEDCLRHITREISRILLDEGFFLGSCPDVSTVGRSVAEAVEDWTARRGEYHWNDVYKIGGQLELPVSTDTNKSLKEMLQQAFYESRKNYLKDYEWVVIIGGGIRTAIEWRAARDLGSVKICAIPAFGGTGLDIWNGQAPNKRCPIPPDLKSWDFDASKNLVKFLSTGG